MNIAELELVARDHHGAIPRRAISCSDDAWQRAHHSGLLVTLHPHVSRLAGTLPSPELAIAAAVIAAGRDAVASHRSAARLWEFPRPDDDPVDVILPARGPARDFRGVHVHRPRDQVGLRPAMLRRGIPCTNVVRLLLDLGAVDRYAVAGAVGHALSCRLTTLPALETAVVEHAERGRHGVVALRRALQEWDIDGRPADSVLEIAMLRLVRRHRLPPVEFHAVIEGWEVDFLVVGTNVVIECDGWTSHGLDRARFERDRIRDAELAAAGWITVRVTYRSVVRHPSNTARRIRAALDRWSPA